MNSLCGIIGALSPFLRNFSGCGLLTSAGPIVLAGCLVDFSSTLTFSRNFDVCLNENNYNKYR